MTQSASAFLTIPDASLPAPKKASLHAQMVLLPVEGAEVSSYWCRKLITAYDGQRTIAQVSTVLHLPLQVCMRLTERAHEAGWVVAQTSAVREDFWQVLSQVMPADVLEQAAQMSRCEVGRVPHRQIGNFLIAVELLLSADQRAEFTPFLDSLRLQYSC